MSGGRIVMALLVAAVSVACTGESESTPPTTVGSTSTPPAPSSTLPSPTSTLATETADLVLTGGQVITMDPDLGMAEAVAITDGDILAVGTSDEVDGLVGDGTTVVGLDGRTVIPGFVDPHTHILTDTGGVDVGQPQALANGITTIAEGFVDPDRLDTLVGAAESGDLRLRTNLYLVRTDNCGNDQGTWYEQHEPGALLADYVRVAGVKVFADGGTCGPIASSEPYREGVETAPPFHDLETLVGYIRAADGEGYQVLVHAIGDVAVEQAMDAYESVLDGQPNDLRHRIDHNSIVTEDMLPRYEEIGVVPVLFGWTSTCDVGPDWSDLWFDFGEDARAVLDANPETVVAWHGDDPWVGPVSPLQEMFNLTTKVEIDEDGTRCDPPPRLADNVISQEEALAMMTTGSAFALGLDDDVGSLTPGKHADLAILSENPLTIDPDTLPEVQVLATLIEGVAQHCAPSFELPICETANGPGLEPAAGAEGWLPADSPRVERVRASFSRQSASRAVDDDPDSNWQSDSAPQWIEIDLGEEVFVDSVSLLVDQSPAGHTVHEIYAGGEPSPTDLVTTLEGETDWGELLEADVGEAVRYIRIRTTESPSWVGWFEIEVETG